MIGIRFSKRTKSLGRNGTMHTDGLIVTRSHQNHVRIEPLNSRKVAGRCYIEIPDQDIQKVIKALKDYQEGAWI